MSDTYTALLLECLVEALQTFAFVAAEPPQGPVPAPAAADLYTLRFQGADSGELQLAAPRAFGCLMAANLLGLEPESEEAKASTGDAVGELANMVGGNMKSGMSLGIRLSMPSVMNGRDYDLRVIGAEVQESHWKIHDSVSCFCGRRPIFCRHRDRHRDERNAGP